MKYKIRQEAPGEEEVIADIVGRAFAGKPYADEGDALIVGKLRESGALVLSLVAEARGQIIGQVALSPASIGDGRYLCLGPIAVLPEFQGQGIGSALMSHALGVAQAYGRDGVVLMGNPAFYERFGFRKYPAVTFDGPGAEYVQVLSFGAEPSGPVTFHAAFG